LCAARPDIVVPPRGAPQSDRWQNGVCIEKDGIDAIQASPVRIIEYFDGRKQSLIPLFQRPYTWEKEKWSVLWDDIMAHYDGGANASHFMGAVVSIPVKTVPVGVNKHLVIDGQQRLTTHSPSSWRSCAMVALPAGLTITCSTGMTKVPTG
jgi:hypothetical protein